MTGEVGCKAAVLGVGGGAGTQAARRLAERSTHPPNLLTQYQVFVVQGPFVLGEKGARSEGSEVSEREACWALGRSTRPPPRLHLSFCGASVC